MRELRDFERGVPNGSFTVATQMVGARGAVCRPERDPYAVATATLTRALVSASGQRGGYG